MLTPNISLTNKTILVTGSAGFIGASLITYLLQMKRNIHIVGLDCVNDYYDVNLKEYRLKQIDDILDKLPAESSTTYTFIKGNIVDKKLVDDLFNQYHFDIVINLAAQAGVRHSVTHPMRYIESNIVGFFNILEACRHSYDKISQNVNPTYQGVQHLVYASSSSVYGSNRKVPYTTDDPTDSPASLYATTKKSNELMAYSYSKLYNIPITGLRLFTVYGPVGRPDMAYFSFTDKLINDEKIQIYNYGHCQRDFTFIDDVVEDISHIIRRAPGGYIDSDGLPIPPYKLYNIGNGHPESLLDFVQILQEELVLTHILPPDYDFENHKEFVPMQPGDIPITFADTSHLEHDFGFKPNTSLREGLHKFIGWYKAFYKI